MTRQLAGTVPLSPLYLAPGSSQNFMLIVSSKTPNALLVTVSDSKTGLPIPTHPCACTRRVTTIRSSPTAAS